MELISILFYNRHIFLFYEGTCLLAELDGIVYFKGLKLRTEGLKGEDFFSPNFF
jgi:hypothetical protein